MRTRYESAKEIFASYGVDTDAVIEKLKTIPLAVQCWQGDYVKGFKLLPYHRQKEAERNKPRNISDNKVQHHPYAILTVGCRKVGEKGKVYGHFYWV